jgi:hypothetical protein
MGRGDKASGIDDAGGEAEAADVAPAHFPDLLLWSPYRAEAPRAFVKLGFVEGDAHRDDLVIPSARSARARDMLHGG